MSLSSDSVRIHDIAIEAKASQSAVYSFLNDRYYGRSNRRTGTGISAETQERILQACRKLEFHPRNQRVYTRVYPEQGGFAFLLNSSIQTPFSNGYFSRFFEGAVGELEGAGHSLIFASFDVEADYNDPRVELHPVLSQQQVNKFIVAGRINRTLIEHLRYLYGFVVTVSRPSDVPGVVSLVPDYRRASALAMEYFQRSGHQSVILYGDLHFDRNGFNTRELIDGAQIASRRQGIDFREEHVVLRRELGDSSAEALRARLGTIDPPVTGAFCCDDASAYALRAALSEGGIRVPEDFSILGCNDEPSFTKKWPELSSVHFPNHEIGARAVEELQKMSRDGAPEGAHTHTIPVELRERASVGSARRAGLNIFI